MTDRISELDRESAAFLEHLAHPEISISEYLETKSVAFARGFDSRKFVYLDTMYWVRLCNAAKDLTRKPDDTNLFANLRVAVADGRIICPFSTPLWWETFHQSDPNTRLLTAKLIDELSQGLTILSEEDRIVAEISDLFERFVLKRTPRYEIRELVFGPTICALGVPIVNSTHWSEPDAAAIQKTLLDEIWHIGFAELVSAPDDLPLKVKGPLAGIAVALNDRRQSRSPSSSFAEENAKEFVGALRYWRETITKAVTICVLRWGGPQPLAQPAFFSEIGRKFSEKLLDAFLHGRLAHGLPTLAIPAGLHAAVARDTKRKYQDNDHHDFSHAAAAMPYCACFATERALAHLLRSQLGYSEIYGARVVTSNEELLSFISSSS